MYFIKKKQLIRRTFFSKLDSHGKETFPGAMGVKATKAVRNKVAEERLVLLANFIGSEHVTRNVAAEYKHYMKGCYLELQQTTNRLFALYKDYLADLLMNALVDRVKENNSNSDSDHNIDSDNDMEEDDSEVKRAQKMYHPLSQSFFYDVLGSKEFCAAVAQNYCCCTCMQAVDTFEVHLPLLIKDCRDLYRQLESALTNEEKEVNFIQLLEAFESRLPKEQDFLLSDGVCFILNYMVNIIMYMP